MEPPLLDCDTIIRNVLIIDGSGNEPRTGGVAITGGRISAVGDVSGCRSNDTVEGHSQSLAPGFIDAHTHDDLYLIRSPQMLPKLSQGVTTVIAGNCGISGSPVPVKQEPPVPANLLGVADEFRYPTFRDYVDAVKAAEPAVNVAAFVGHTTLRNNHMDRLDRPAASPEVSAMRAQLSEALRHGALGLSTGLAYRSAHAASEDEVSKLAEPLSDHEAIYATHMRTEGAQILTAIDEALRLGRRLNVPVVISHLKCAGIDNWHRSGEVLALLQKAIANQVIGWDCYPYAASSTTLDLGQVDERIRITITWSTPFPALAGQPLSQIAESWGLSQIDAARRLQPAGAIYHGMSEDDVQAILQHRETMIGSDGLPNDRFPHPRLWGTFPRVLGHYSRENKLISLADAVRKMTSLPAQRFRLHDRGWIKQGYAADLVLFDPHSVCDEATFASPTTPASGITAVWVNGTLSYTKQGPAAQRAGRFLSRQSAPKMNSLISQGETQ
jgi:N-acyl-D-aspartate/D-glutamate deacylase